MKDRRCEQCHQKTPGFLRMTKRVDGVLVLACEDCALDLERDKRAIDAARRAVGEGDAA